MYGDYVVCWICKLKRHHLYIFESTELSSIFSHLLVKKDILTMSQNATSYSMNLADDLSVNSGVYVRVWPFRLCPVIFTVTWLVDRLLGRAGYTWKNKQKQWHEPTIFMDTWMCFLQAKNHEYIQFCILIKTDFHIMTVELFWFWFFFFFNI